MKGTMRLSRAQSNQRPDFIHVTVTDEASRIQFLDIEMSLLDFANLLTNHQAVVELDLISVKGYERVGKKQEVQAFSVTMELSEAEASKKGRPELIEKLRQILEVDGWEMDTYLDSRDSVKWLGNGKWQVNGVLRRWR